MSLEVPLRSAPKSQYWAKEYSSKTIGITVKELTQDIIFNNDLDFDTEGVWVAQVEDAGSASLAGLSINDLILKVNDKLVKTLDDFSQQLESVLEKRPRYISLFIQRGRTTRFLYVKIEDNQYSGS